MTIKLCGVRRPGLAAAVFALLLAVSDVAPAADVQLSPSQRANLRAAFKAATAGKWTQARRHATRAHIPLAGKMIQWMWLTARGNTAPFDKIAAFIDREPGWPRQTILQRRAEEALTSRIPDQTVLTWFRHRKPISTDGQMRLAAALLARGRTNEAQKIIKDAWISGVFGSRQERKFYRRYRKYLTREDHIQRLDRLLWQGNYYPVRRMYRRVNTDYRALAEARVALRRMRGGVDRAINRVPVALRSHPGLVYERLRWRRRKGRNLHVRELLENPPEDLVRPDRWWRERFILSRRALREGHISEAYKLAKHHGLRDGAGYVEAEWLAGWIALRFLGDHEEAYTHFTEIMRVARYPISRARGSYWAGRAAEAQNDSKRARFWYGAATAHPTTAVSTGRCNTCVKSLCRRFELQRFAGPFVELPCHLVQMRLRVYRQVGALGEVLSEQAVGVLVGSALPRTSRVTEVNIDVGRQAKPPMIREFLAPIPGQRFVQLGR